MKMRASFISRTNFNSHSKIAGFRYTSPASGVSMRRPNIDPLEVPNYTLEEASRYLHVNLSTLRYWIIGSATIAPLSTVFVREPALLSFKNLVECYVLEGLRQTHGVSLQSIRASVEDLRVRTKSKYPLADHQLGTVGNTIYLEDERKPLLELGSGGQQVFKTILEPFLKRVERDEKGLARMFPFTRKEHLRSPTNAPRVVVIDPSVAFGMPVLVNSRISTAFLRSRNKGGASISQLAADYGRSEAEIEEAIKLEEAA
jgi:uncharacterized protein (DUF433 family)